ncbi:THAP domain-containing protein 7 isoform X2 [Salminus brasiliensis]|uniref:THAP domain-containing protein 7 isoform X2 n=1 Tax=Salminus brasiliensis TaxID=930266 RepID=UPI003B831FBF
MPRHCSAAGCNSRDTREARKAGLTFHRLPKRGNPRRATWILNSHRKGPEGKGQWDPQSDYIYFCSKHFSPDSFELSGVSGYRRLKDDAVPTVVETPPYQRGKTSRGRGRPQNVERQIGTSNEKERPESKDVPASEAFLQNVTAGEEAENSKTVNGEPGNEQSPSSLSENVQTNKISLHGQPADLIPDPTAPRPLSPSCYMRRLPPPPGFYLAKEHNYAQLCPLVWRKRYDKAIDNLEKALRLLSAARRRENRLRLTLLRLRENRLKSTLSRTQDSGRRKEGRWKLSFSAPLGGKAARAERSETPEGLEESEIEGTPEDMDIFTEEGWRRPAPTTKERAAVEEEEGCCFYCGRGREDEESKEVRDRRMSLRATESHLALGGSKPRRIQEGKSVKMPGVSTLRRAESTKNDVPVVEPKDCYFFYCENDSGNEDQTKSVSTDLTPQQEQLDCEASLELCSKPLQHLTLLHPQTEMLLQMHTLPGPAQPTVTLQETTSSTPQLPQVHLLQPSLGLQPNLLLPDMATREGNATQSESEGGNRMYWVQERTDSHVLLVPVSAETREKSGGSVDTMLQNIETQSILITEESFQQGASDEGYSLSVESDPVGLRNTGLRDSQNSHQSNVRATMLSGDVRQRLKEHLEGFHLQLSNEFTD